MLVFLWISPLYTYFVHSLFSNLPFSPKAFRYQAFIGTVTTCVFGVISYLLGTWFLLSDCGHKDSCTDWLGQWTGWLRRWAVGLGSRSSDWPKSCRCSAGPGCPSQTRPLREAATRKGNALCCMGVSGKSFLWLDILSLCCFFWLSFHLVFNVLKVFWKYFISVFHFSCFLNS